MVGNLGYSSAELGPLVVQIAVSNAAEAIGFYRSVFDASELYRSIDEDGGRIVHCELLIGHARIVVQDEFKEFGLLSPATLGGASVSLNLYLDDVDAVFTKAIAAGARVISEPQNRFWGARSGSFLDPFGHRWIVSTQIDDPSPEEIVDRSANAAVHARLSAAPTPVKG
jgi:PhnB protein